MHLTRGTPHLVAVGVAVSAIVTGCRGPSFDPASRITSLRVLAIQAEPPEVAPGASTMLQTLAVDPASGATIAIDWAACTEPAAPGTGAVNPDCLTHDSAPYLVPLGSGLSTPITVPTIDPTAFGPPDASGGRYLPLRGRAQVPGEQVDAIDRLRMATGTPPNHNPQIADVVTVAPDGTQTSLSETTPLEVYSLEQVTLATLFTSDSAESYDVSVAGQTMSVTELLRVTWFSTAGTFSEDITGQSKPNTVWRADELLPAPGGTVDIYVVGRDERGGTAFAHRSMKVIQ